MTNYRTYITSSKWRERRKAYEKKHPKRCKVKGCKVKGQIELHHRTYERLGCERDADLVWLCWRHHRAVHHLANTSSLSLERATDHWLKRKPRYNNNKGKALARKKG